MNKEIEKKRNQLISEIQKTDRLRQGTISEQYYGTGKKKQGPYYVFQGYKNGKHWSKRIPKNELEQYETDINTSIRLKELYKEFADAIEESTINEEHSANKKKLKKLP